ncbi:uncharacterized protein LOC103788187 isoform X4 [Callithrix jacchus]
MQGQSCSSDNKAAWGCAWIPWPECLDSNLSSTTYHFCDVGSFTETMTTRGQTFYITPLERRNPSLGSFNWENTREVIYPMPAEQVTESKGQCSPWQSTP